jgi:hypothetical protein
MQIPTSSGRDEIWVGFNTGDKVRVHANGSAVWLEGSYKGAKPRVFQGHKNNGVDHGWCFLRYADPPEDKFIDTDF